MLYMGGVTVWGGGGRPCSFSQHIMNVRWPRDEVRSYHLQPELMTTAPRPNTLTDASHHSPLKCSENI